MFTLINSSLRSIQNSPITMGFLSETNKQYAKIAAVVSVIFLALTAATYLICRPYRANRADAKTKVPTPNSQNNQPDPTKKPDDKNLDNNQGKKDLKNDDPNKKDLPRDINREEFQEMFGKAEAAYWEYVLQKEREDRIKNDDQNKKNSPSPKKSDEDIAREMQQDEYLKKDDDLDKDNTPTERDEEMAKRLQEEEDAKNKKPPVTSPVKPKPDPDKPVVSSPVLKPKTPQTNSSPQKSKDETKDTAKGETKDTAIEPSKADIDSPEFVDDSPIQKVDSPPKEKPKAPPSPFTQIEKACGEISEKIFTDSSFSAVKALSIIDFKLENQIRGLLDEIVVEFERRYPQLQKIRYGDSVPEYFANVQGFQSTEERKYLSLVGIRNLLRFGPRIVDDFRKQRFLGGEHHYNDNEGLRLFKKHTGNVVDLDTEIDAPSATAAVEQAKELIINFGKTCGLKKPGGGELTADEVARQLPHRKLELPMLGGTIHTAIDHQDRSTYGIWQRVAPKTLKTYYYVNVPNCNIVLLATLRMPLLLAELAYRTKEQNNGKLTKEFFDEFFNKGLSDMCFNDKAKTFMDFYHTWSAKLNGELLDPKEDARRKLTKGVFGTELQKKNPNVVIKEAFTSSSLMGFIAKASDDDEFYSVKGRSYEKYVKDVQDKTIDYLKAQGKWEASLYRRKDAADADYFLLNQSTLNIFMKDLYEAMQYM